MSKFMMGGLAISAYSVAGTNYFWGGITTSLFVKSSKHKMLFADANKDELKIEKRKHEKCALGLLLYVMSSDRKNDSLIINF